MSGTAMPYDNPPSKFCGALPAGSDVYYQLGAETNPVIWHWCQRDERWQAAGTSKHYLIGQEPLHLEPSLMWDCCGKHGWIRDGSWTAA